MSRIHSTAIIDSKAHLDSSVEVGPFSIIGSNVTIDEGTKIGPYVNITSHTHIGKNNQIFNHSCIGTPAQDISLKDSTEIIGSIKIGDNNIIRESSTIHAPSKQDSQTTIGNNNYFMVNTHIAHDCQLGHNIIIANNTALGGFVNVEDACFISANVVIHQFCNIGRLCIISGGVKVAEDVPPFVMAFGGRAVASALNSIGLKRAKLKIETRSLIKKVFKIFYLESNTVKAAVSKIESTILNSLDNSSEEYKEIKHFIDFIKKSKRGIIHYAGKNSFSL